MPHPHPHPDDQPQPQPTLPLLPSTPPSSYPATTTQAASILAGIKTDVLHISFSDKILLTITQGGRLSQWITVPLLSDNPTSSDTYFSTTNNQNTEEALLPRARFQARTLVGAGTAGRETMGHVYASQIAHAITTKTPGETRSLVLGLGLVAVDMERDTFLGVIDLVLKVI